VLILTGERKQATLDIAVLRGARGVLRKDASAEQVLKAIEKTHQGELWLDRETLGRVFGELMNPVGTQKLDSETEKKAALTAKEQKIIHTIVEGSGASNKALAQKLFISEHTLCNHLTSIYHKLDVSNRLELYVYAIKHQLGNPDCSSMHPPAQHRHDGPDDLNHGRPHDDHDN
jgi:DNA-binding NarL/FixJ family response regulator